MSGHVRRPGPVAWLVIVAGFVVMGWAVWGVFAESERTAPASWFTWLIGGALVHDLVVLPLVVLVGIGFASMARPGLARCLRWAVAVGAVITVASFPVVARFGERSDNPTVLPLPAGRNLVFIWLGLLAVAVVVGVVWDSRLAARSAAGGGDPIDEPVEGDTREVEVGSTPGGESGPGKAGSTKAGSTKAGSTKAGSGRSAKGKTASGGDTASSGGTD